MKITKRQLRRIIKEEKAALLNELTPGDAGIAAAGGGTPADQGFAAAAEPSVPQQLLEELEAVLYQIKQFYLKMDYSDDPAMIQSAIASVISAEVEGFMEENLPHRAQY